jgi:adenylate kinase
MDITTIDIPSTVTAILTIIVAVGGVLGKTYVGKALEGLALVADILVDVGDLMVTIAKAGEDGALSPEEWASIKEKAREIQTHLIAIQGKFGTILG